MPIVNQDQKSLPQVLSALMPEANQTAILIGPPPSEPIKPGEDVPTEQPPVVPEGVKLEDLPSAASEPIQKDNVVVLLPGDVTPEEAKQILETIPEDKNVTLFIGPEQISNGSTPIEDITEALEVNEDLKDLINNIEPAQPEEILQILQDYPPEDNAFLPVVNPSNQELLPMLDFQMAPESDKEVLRPIELAPLMEPESKPVLSVPSISELSPELNPEIVNDIIADLPENLQTTGKNILCPKSKNGNLNYVPKSIM